MSLPESKSQSILPNWVDSALFKGMLRGIERESLRMQSNGFLSQADHPKSLGSALTHPHITTDYSEALMEFITPPKETIPEALNYLSDIHAYVHRHLENGEKLWPLSMPCMLDDKEENIEEISEKVTYAVKADVREPGILKALGVQNVDVAIIAVAENLEASISATM